MRQEWFNPGNGRRYLIELYEDLLGDWILLRSWSGLHRPGNSKMALMTSHADALQQLKSIEDIRQKRGYQRVL
jgi:predicted DNA-binding WGR domain protein